MVDAKLNKTLRLIALVILLGVIAYIFLLNTSADTADLRQKIAQLSLSDVLAPIVLSLISYLLRFIRWRLILRQMGYRLQLRYDLTYYLSGFALTMTPGKSGETIRSAFLLQTRVPVHNSFSAFVLERSFDLLVVGILATALFIHPMYSLLVFIGALLCISLLAVRIERLGRLTSKIEWPAPLRGLLLMLIRASTLLRLKFVTIYAFLGSAAWLAQGLGFYFIVDLFNQESYTQDFDILAAISTYCAGLFIGAISLIPGGIGVTEGSLSWLLQTQGFDQNAALLAALLSRICTLWLAVAIGCFALTVIIKGSNQTLPYCEEFEETTP